MSVVEEEKLLVEIDESTETTYLNLKVKRDKNGKLYLLFQDCLDSLKFKSLAEYDYVAQEFLEFFSTILTHEEYFWLTWKFREAKKLLEVALGK